MTNKELIAILQQWPSDCLVKIEGMYTCALSGEVEAEYIKMSEDNICQGAGIIFLGSNE